MKLDGKVALVTGGASGIGAAAATRFVSEGAKVCLVDINEDGLAKTAGTLPKGTVITCTTDVSKPADIERAVAATLDFGGRLDILMNSAGINLFGSIVDVDLAHWRRTMEVNLDGPFYFMRAAIPHMIRGGGGSIINIASLAGIRTMPGAAPYCTAKAGLIMLTQQAAVEYGPHKIRCNAVCPGCILTPITTNLFEPMMEKLGTDVETFLTKASSDLPLRRPSHAVEFAGLCSFLASDESSFMTGAVLVMDGGTHVMDSFPLGVQKAIASYGIPMEELAPPGHEK